MSAKEITRALWRNFSGSSDLILPRFTPNSWFECDVWRLTKAQFVDEFEIKMTVADFKADMAKSHRKGHDYDRENRRLIERPEKSKHGLLAAGQGHPNRFWFVVPETLAGLIRPHLPAHAGLMVAHFYQNGRCSGIYAERQAPRIHGHKWKGDRQKILTTAYWRYWNHEVRSKDPIEPFTPLELPEIEVCSPEVQPLLLP